MLVLPPAAESGADREHPATDPSPIDRSPGSRSPLARVRRPGGPSLSAKRIADALGQPRPTAQQQSVIEQPPGPMLVVAGAGSGKTETMAARVVWLVANGFVDPDQVLGLTFTRKAAAELSARVVARLRALREAGLWQPADGTADLGAAPPTISTYHAYAARLVREHALRVGREPESRLLSEAAAWQVAAEVVTAYDGPLDEIGKAESTITNAVVDLAGELAEHLVTPAELAGWLNAIDTRLAAIEAGGKPLLSGSKDMRAALRGRRALVPVLERFGDLKRRRGALDFADQMALAARIAMRFPEVGIIERARFGAVLLDEFQDTSHAQLQFLAALFAPDSGAHPVTAVGDPNQSIYAWRGASAATLAQFPVAFGGEATPVLPLSVTWRNDRGILAAANVVAAPLRARSRVPVTPLDPAPQAPDGRIDVARAETVEAEATAVASWIGAELAGGAKSAAVLCRKRSQFEPVIEALGAAGLPYEVVGLGGLLLTPEVQDVVALLSIAHDAARGDRLMRLLTGPLCRLGAADLDRFHAWARSRQQPPTPNGASAGPSDLSADAADRVSLVEALVDFGRATTGEREAAGVSATGSRRLVTLAARLAELRSVNAVGLADLVGAAERILGLDIEVLARPEFSPAAGRAHLDAFADVAASFAASSDRPTLGGFLAWLDAALLEERGLDLGTIDIAPGAVHVLTVHAAKGLEWDAVAVPGLVEAGFPVHKSVQSVYDEATQQWRASEPNDGAWTVGLDGLPYDLRGDRDDLPGFDWRSATGAKDLDTRREEFRAAAGRHLLDEERRLAYVALTRARHRMLLTCAVWGTQASPRVPSRFLTELLEQRPDLLEIGTWVPDPEPGAANPRLAEPMRGAWPTRPPTPAGLIAAADLVQAAERGDGPAAPVVSEQVELLLAERERRRTLDRAWQGTAPPRDWRILDALDGHLTTTELVRFAADPDAFAVSVRRPMPQPPAPALRRGSTFHLWVERHYRRAALLDPDDLPGSADDDAPDEYDLDELIGHFLAGPWAAQVPIEVEVAVEAVVGSLAVRGRIDAVFARPGGGVTIIDWKTGRPPVGAEAHAQAVQLAIYRAAYARLRGLDEATQVDAAFYYAATGETVYPALRSGTDLEALIATLE
ncbi:ATP-dependent DNA helicase [Nostocoides vanveenii]|uniref:DNA 3'-5' helicase n=1 Tax=Nostocoides vanveenii TaxID=330835 RepID=A0ABN2K1M8_9MICO